MSKMVNYSVSSQDVKYRCFGFPMLSNTRHKRFGLAQATNPVFNELGMQLNYLI